MLINNNDNQVVEETITHFKCVNGQLKKNTICVVPLRLLMDIIPDQKEIEFINGYSIFNRSHDQLNFPGPTK